MHCREINKVLMSNSFYLTPTTIKVNIDLNKTTLYQTVVSGLAHWIRNPSTASTDQD